MTPKQKKFCREYVKAGKENATQAAIRAGYSEKTARSMANENLTKPDIQKEIKRLSKKADLEGKEQEEERSAIASLEEIAETLTRRFRREEYEEEIIQQTAPDGKVITTKKRRKVSVKDSTDAGDKLIRLKGGYQDKTSLDINASAQVVIMDDVTEDW